MKDITLSLAAFVVVAAAYAQETPAAPSTPTEARRFFDAAALAQDPDGRATAIESLEIEANFATFEDDKPRSTGTIRQYWAKPAEKDAANAAYRRETQLDAGGRWQVQVQSSDGSFHVSGEGDAIRPMTGSGYDADRQRLRRERERIEQLLGLLLLRKLDFDDTKLRLRKDEETIRFVIGGGRQGTWEHTTRVLELDDRAGRSMTLWFAQPGQDLVQAQVLDPKLPGIVQEFCMAGHRDASFKDGAGRLRAPREILYREGGKKVLEVRCPNDQFVLNGLDPARRKQLFEFEQ